MLSSIGFVGIGIMGKGMIKNLVTKVLAAPGSPPLVIWNRSPEVCQEMMSLYPGKITVAPTAADVVRQCSMTYSMLSTPEAAAAVYDAPDVGLIAGVSPGKCIIDCATLSPERMIKEAAMITAKGGKFLEAPVSGSKVPADTGTLIFLCGGDPEVYAAASEHLDAMGKAKYLFGEVGQGSRVKLVVNMIMGTMMGAFTEGLALGKASDIPLDLLLQVLDQSAMSNPMFKGKGASILAENYSAHFPLKHAQKDMRLALELASQKGITLPTTTAANQVFVKAIEEKNCGDEDFSSVFKAL